MYVSDEDFVLPHPVEKQAQTLQKNQGCHYPVDTEDLGMKCHFQRFIEQTCSVPFFLRMKTQKQPETKKRMESIW